MINVKQSIAKHITLTRLINNNLHPYLFEAKDTKRVIVEGQTYHAFFKPESKFNRIETLKHLVNFDGVIGFEEYTGGAFLTDISGEVHRANGYNDIDKKIAYIEQHLVEKYPLTFIDDRVAVCGVGLECPIKNFGQANGIIQQYHGDFKTNNLYHIYCQYTSHKGAVEKALVIKEVTPLGIKIMHRVGLHHQTQFHTTISIALLD